MKHIVRSAVKATRLCASFSQVAEASSKGSRVATRDTLQFSKKRLVDFGELPFG